MACPAVQSGQNFLATALAHVDCQAQAIGAYGYGALSDPASGVALALTSLLTIFVALFGIRLLLGHPMVGRDVVTDVLKVGIVLTLATSWPAWRVLGYDLLINGPAQIAQAIGLAAQLPGSSGDLASRLQRVDTGLAALNVFGSGRLGVAQGDWFQLGFARIAFLAGTLGPLALIRLMTGILLAIAPLMAGLLLFGVSRPIFVGWVRGLVMAFLASISLSVVLGAQLALIEPWLQDALRRRQFEQQVLDAPVEILVVTLAFALILFGVLAIMARVAFQPNSWVATMLPIESKDRMRETVDRLIAVGNDEGAHARTVAMAVSESLRREERVSSTSRAIAGALAAQTVTTSPSGRAGQVEPAEMLGSSYRRGTRRVSAASQRRDRSS